MTTEEDNARKEIEEAKERQRQNERECSGYYTLSEMKEDNERLQDYIDDLEDKIKKGVFSD
jgi:hypothetical protein